MKDSKFNKKYKAIMESIPAASANMGSASNDITSTTDSYAPGDTRIPKILGKKKKIIRRPFARSL